MILYNPSLPCVSGNTRPKEYCGIFGIYGHPEAARLTYFGLYALQHRGQESCGIITGDNYQVRQHKGLGLVPDVFNQPALDSLTGHLAIGHVRYSTTGSTLLRNAQPFVVHHGGETLAIGHNGNLVTPRNSITAWNRKVPSSNRPWTPRLSFTSWPGICGAA